MIVFVPIPAVAGLKVFADTPGPEYVPFNGMPPFNLMGLAFIVVILSKQNVNVTIGASVPLMMILFEVAGLPDTQFRFEVITHHTLSLLAGLKV